MKRKIENKGREKAMFKRSLAGMAEGRLVTVCGKILTVTIQIHSHFSC